MSNRNSLPVIARSLLLSSFLLITYHSSLITVPGQSATATLSGTVVDANGAVVPGASVRLINSATGLQRETKTNDSGDFTAPLLHPSTYTLRVERQGFAPAEIQDLVLNVGDQKSLKIQLKAGNISELVQITNDAPLIDESPAVATTVNRTFVENIPLNGRTFQSLINLAPGVVTTKSSVANQGQFSVNGQRSTANYFTVDGVSANTGISSAGTLNQTGAGTSPAFTASGGTASIVSLDAMQEFKIQTSTFAPEFGRTPGAQVQIVTRSGTNKFTGTLFEYFRNDALEANDWFGNSRGLARPALRQNNFGGVIGGPVFLPLFGEGGDRFYNGRNRTFFFFSYEGLRLRLPQTRITSVPSLAVRNAASAQIRPYLDAYPIPNGRALTGGAAEFNASLSDPSSFDATSFRLDHSPSSKINVFGRYNYAPSESLVRGAIISTLNSITSTRGSNETLTLGSTQSFSSSVINEIRFNYTKTIGEAERQLDNLGGAVPLSESQMFPSFADPAASSFSFQITGLGQLESGPLTKNEQRQFNIVDNLTLVVGNHQTKFGFDYRSLSPFKDGNEFILNATFSNLSASNGGVLSGITNFALVQTTGDVEIGFRNFSLYGQDTWKVNPRLTLTYGARWDINPPPKGRGGKPIYAFQNFDSPTQIGLAPENTPLYATTYNNIAPRFGAAWRLGDKQGRETTLRGGIGLFYDLGFASLANSVVGFPHNRFFLRSAEPFPISETRAVPPAFTLNPPFGVIFIPDPNLKLPYIWQWNVTLEQSLGKDQIISAAYVAALGRRLIRSSIFANSTRYTRADFFNNDSTSDYHAFQLKFSRRLSQGLQALASYTWSKSLDTTSSDAASTGPIGRIETSLDRGPSDFEVRHSFNAAVTYALPTISSNGFVEAILNDWFIDAIVSARTATPVNVTVSRTLTGVGSFSLRPDLVEGVPLYIDDDTVGGGRRINRAAFTIPSTFRQGTFGRNILRGFPLRQIDFALRRKFNFNETTSLQLKAEVFNIFNTPNFADPLSAFGNVSGTGVFTPNATFGQSNQMLGRSLGSGGVSGGLNPLYQIGGPRSVQLVLRLQF